MLKLLTMNEKIIKCLKDSYFANGLNDEHLNCLAAIARFSDFHSKKFIFFQNQEADGFYLIAKGEVKIFVIGNDGREQIIHRLHKGETFGEVAVFQGKSFPATAVATIDSELLFFPKSSFLSVSRKNPDLLLNIIAILSSHLRRMVNMIDDLSLKDVESRLAKFLIEQNSEIVQLKVSKTELSSQIGTIPATLSRTLKKLQKKNVIKISGRTIEIINEDILNNIANCENL